MDWLLAGFIGAGMYCVGWLAGHLQGVKDGRSLERISRRIDEVTETVRLETPRH